jgi:putative membrane protein
MGVKFFAAAAVTGLLLNAIAAAPSAAQQGGLAADSSFIATAASLGLMQVQLGKMAQDKATSPAVRDFAKRMVDEYTKTNEQLAAGAKQSGFPHPVVLRQHQQVLDRFFRMGKSSFDKSYMEEMVNQDRTAVQLFQDEREGGKVASLKQLASQLLPSVQQHLSLATETAGAVGAEVTAANQRERQGS